MADVTGGRTSKASSARRDDGFTLVELMLVIVIIAVLIAVGLPTFLGARTRAQDTAAQARAKHGLKMQDVFYSDNAGFGTADQVQPVDDSVQLAPYDPATGPEVLGTVYVRLDSTDAVTLVSKSASGVCFWTRQDNGVTTYARGDCSTPPDPASFGPSW